MSRYTDEDFETSADDELAWRKIELHALAKELDAANRRNPSSPATRALARGMATLLYAHWEGYCKAIFEAYLRLVLKRKPRLVDAADGFVLAHTQHLLRRIDSGDTSAANDLIALARGYSTERLRLNQDKIVDTKSNLRYKTLEDIMTSLSFPISDLSLRKNLIDTQLCDSRNEIAHGRASFPAPEEVLELHQRVLEMMNQIRDIAIGQVRTKGYSLHEKPS